MKTKQFMRLVSIALIAIASLGTFSCSSDDDYEQDYAGAFEAPKNVRGTASAGKVTLIWDAVFGATSYKVFRSADGSRFSELGTSSENSFTDNAPLSGSNYYCVQALGGYGTVSEKSAGTQPIVSDGQSGSGIYIGLIGFNQKLMHYPIHRLTERSKLGIYDFIDAFNSDNDGTAVYYAVDQAISTLKGKSYPTDLNKVYIVTFTDGIDNYSLELYDKFSASDACGDYVKSRLTSEKVAGTDITGWAVGLKHNDVNDARFDATLNRIASSSSLAYKRTDMSAVEAKFKEIAKNITEVNKTQNITVSIAGGLDDGERIRFTFDLSENSTSATYSSFYIEGTYRRETRTLTNITAKGLTLKGTEVVGTKNATTGLIDFTFHEVVASDNKLIDNGKILEWWGTPWQKDTEFNPGTNTKTEVSFHSAAIMLVLDCTYSLGSKFKEMQTSAKSFISTLLEQAYTDDVYHDGHGYVNLGLPSGLKWASCNIGASSPSDYGNYYAWGETTTKDIYSMGNSVTSKKSFGDISGNARYDAARANWGGSWRLPSRTECMELKSKCTWTWTSQSGHEGYKVIGPNGNSIFLPAAGKRNGYDLQSTETLCYWSSTSNESDTELAYNLNSSPYSNIPQFEWCNRYHGLPVRPVSK